MTPDTKHIKRIRFAMAKVAVAERLLREARQELKRAVEGACHPTHPPTDGERKPVAA